MFTNLFPQREQERQSAVASALQQIARIATQNRVIVSARVKVASNCRNKFTNSPLPVPTPVLKNPPLKHSTRASNTTDASISRQAKIKLPPASAKSEWAKINEELASTLPNMFPTALIDELSSSELIQQLDEHIYNKLLSHFGEITKAKNNGYPQLSETKTV